MPEQPWWSGDAWSAPQPPYGEPELVPTRHEDAGRIADGGGVGLVVGLRSGHGMQGSHSRDAQFAEDLSVAFARFHAHGRRRRDDRDRGVLTTGKGDEAAEDDPIADLVLGAADDDDRSVRQEDTS